MTEEPWLTLTEAAERTGQNREALRSRARRGLIPSRKGNSGELLVQVTPGQTANLDHAIAMKLTGAETDLLAEVADLRTVIARLEAERDAARTGAAVEIAAVRAQAAGELAARNMVIEELRAMLAEARRPWWRWVGS